MAVDLRHTPLLPFEVDERAARTALRTQIARLEEQLAAYAAMTPTGRDRGARLLTLGELEGQRDALAGCLAEVRRAEDERGQQQEAYRGLLEEVMLDPAAHPWARVTNADIGEPGCRQVHALPAFGILGRMLNWWRVRISSGCPLCMS